jgi:predicted flap endonuclease-1-like 5' DNA nuclease
MKRNHTKRSWLWIIPLILLFPAIIITIGILLWMKKYDKYYADLTKNALKNNEIILGQVDIDTRPELDLARTTVQESEIPVSMDLDPDQDRPLSDDLTRIEGIGPKTSVVLQNSGIISFTKLANSSIEDLTILLRSNGLRARPDTWPQQASLAAIGAWDELIALQAKLKGGI